MRNAQTFNRVFIVGALLLCGCINTQAANVLHGFVLLGQSATGEATPMARIILEGTDQACPQLLPDSPGQTVSSSARTNPDPLHFPITVCEALYPFGQSMKLADGSLSLPAIDQQINSVAVFGDSGCKPSHQDCTADSANWPFPALIKTATQHQPDLVLHMGDYNYSGTPGSITIDGLGTVGVYDAGDNTTQGMCQIAGGWYGQNTPGSQQPDSWSHWHNDFFQAADPLLKTAPWVFARGNHELCSRAGTGWFYLLDPNSSLLGDYQQQLHCPAASNPTPNVLSAPYLINLKGLNVAVLDSANACDAGLLNEDAYQNQLVLMNRLVAQTDHDDPTWVQSHRPFWGVDKQDDTGACGSDSNQYCMVTQTIQQVMDSEPLNQHVQLILSGHMHRFQLVDFKSGKHPDQFVVGNSGVKLAHMHPKKTKTLTVDGHQATVMGLDQFGFMNFDLGKHQAWQGQVLNSQNQVMLSCDSQQKPLCQNPE